MHDARAFLRLATAGINYGSARDPISQAYFRELHDAPGAQREGSGAPRVEGGFGRSTAARRRWARGGRCRELAVCRCAGRTDDGGARAHFTSEGRGSVPGEHLVSASRSLEPKLRPVDALELVIQILARGLLEHSSGGGGTALTAMASAVAVVAEVPADRLFRTGWHHGAGREGWAQDWKNRIIASLGPPASGER